MTQIKTATAWQLRTRPALLSTAPVAPVWKVERLTQPQTKPASKTQVVLVGNDADQPIFARAA